MSNQQPKQPAGAGSRALYCSAVQSAQTTPMPWRVRRDECHFGSATSIVGGRAGSDGWHEIMIEVGGLANVDTQEANAQLIAAAPELLDALAMLYDAFPDCDGGRAGAACMMARRAMEKAGILPNAESRHARNER